MFSQLVIAPLALSVVQSTTFAYVRSKLKSVDMSNFCQLLANIGPISGNNVSKSKRHTKRRFLPNIQSMSFPSSMGSKKLKIASRTRRTILKYGGLDAFLLSIKAGKLTPLGRKMRRKLQKMVPVPVGDKESVAAPLIATQASV